MRVLLVTIPLNPVPTGFPPMGCLSIIHYLRKQGTCEAELLNIDSSRIDYGEVLEQIKLRKPDVLGISAVVSTSYHYTRRLAVDVKEMLPETLIVVGGNMAASAEVLLRKASIDICVIGEGEVVFDNMVMRAKETTNPVDYTDIKGLAFLDDEGKMVNTGYEAPLLASQLYDMNWEDLAKCSDIDFYFPPAFVDGKPVGQWQLTDPRTYEAHRRDKTVGFLACVKGCVARCTFCHRFEKGVRHIPVPVLMARIEEMISKFNVGFLRLGLETFGIDKRWLKEFCEEIKKFDVLWESGVTRADSVTQEWIATMKDAGCIALSFGNETGSERILKIMEKKVDMEENNNALKWTVEAELFTTIQLVLGMPGENRETIKETIGFCNRAISWSSRMSPYDFSINRVMALPGSPLYEYGRRKGMIGGDVDSEEKYLLSISNCYTNDDPRTLNFTGYPELEFRIWMMLITVEVNYHYVRMYGIDHYNQMLAQSIGISGERQEALKLLSPAPKSGAEDIPLPSVMSLLSSGQFGLAMRRCPVLFYRIRHFLWIFVLIKVVRNQGVAITIGLFAEYVVHKIKSTVMPRKFEYDYKSLRKIIEKDISPLPNDTEEMVPLRKGR